MARIDVADFDITVSAVAKLWDHGIVPDQLYAVLDRFWIVIRNRRDRAASHVLLGTDDQGRSLAVPIVPTDDRLTWRPITAWYCKPSEAAKLRQWRGIMEERIGYESIQEPLDDEERELMDPDHWDWDNPIEGRTIGSPGAIVRVRFTREEIVALDRIAREAGANPVDLIHQILREWIANRNTDTPEPRIKQPVRAPHAATG